MAISRLVVAAAIVLGALTAVHVTAKPTSKTFDCCLDPSCPPGCSIECPGDCDECPSSPLCP
jgi:hypothetical protein